MGNVATLIEESRRTSNGEEVTFANQTLHRSDARSALEKLLVDLPNLERLICFNTGLKEVPPVVSEFKRLSIVRVDQNKLTAFPDLPNATEVDASANVITAFPAARSIKSCVMLNLARNQIAAVPSTGGALKLTALNLEGNVVTAVPLSLSELKALISLNLRDNKITAVGDEISKLTPSLKELYLGKNKIASLPGSISALTALSHLDLSENALKTLPPQMNALAELSTLDLQHNSLGPVLPGVVCSFSALTILRLHDNKLASLPHEIKQLRSLQELHVQENELTVLPPEIGSLSALRKLYLEYNKLTDLPAEMAHLKGLAVLILHHNLLKEVPQPLLALKQLLRLSLEDNPLPADVLATIRTQGALSLITGAAPGTPTPEKSPSVPTLLTPPTDPVPLQRKSSEGSPSPRSPRSSTDGSSAAPLNYNQFKDAWEGLMTQQDFSKQRKQMLEGMSDEAKWALLNQYKGSTLELLKVAPNKGSIIKPAGKARSAAEFVTILRGRPTRTDLTQLADHLDPAKPMHVAGFLASFIEAQGIAALLKLADSFAKRAIRNAEDDVIQLGAVKCLRILSSVALRSFLTTTGACSVMAAQLLSTHQEVVRTAMAVLDSIASLHVGHSFISEALPVPPAADGSGPDPAGKFALLLRILSEDTAASKEGGPAKELSLSQLALKHQALNVINAIIEGREELDARFTLRNQLVRAGMLEVVGSLRELSANHEGLQDALDRFEEGMSHDTEEMMEKLESRGAAGAQEATFTTAPAPSADSEATAGDFLRVLVLSGTALKQFVVAYKPEDKVAAVLRALQTQLGPADSALLHDYELHVVSPPIWLSSEAAMSSYHLPKGETKAEFKHKPQMLRVEGPGGATITEPVSPLMNVGAVVHLLLERFMASKPPASPSAPAAAVGLSASSTQAAVSAEEEYGLYLQPAEAAKSEEGVWLKDTAKLQEYDTSKGRLLLRLKQIPTKVMFSDESFRVFMFERTAKVRAAIDQVCDTISMREKAADYGLLLLRSKGAHDAPAATAASTPGGGADKDQAPKWLKDSKTLEYYAIDANSTLKLQLKPKTVPVFLPNGKMESMAVDLSLTPTSLMTRILKKKLLKERAADFELCYTLQASLTKSAKAPKRLKDAAGSVNDQIGGDLEALHFKPRISKPDSALVPSLTSPIERAHTPTGSASATPRDRDEEESTASSDKDTSMWEEPSDEAHVTYDAAKRIEAGTLNKLIEYVTNPDNLDPEVQNIFLMTYKSFTTPLELWTKLVERYHVPDTLPEKVTERIRLRVGVFMTAWLKSKHDDFGEDLRQKIHQFATALAGSPTGERLSAILISALQMQERVSVVQMKEPPPPRLPRQLTESLTLFDLDEVEIARQLTMKVWLPFSRLKPIEFFNSAWSKPKLAHLAPNLLAVIAVFNDVGRWVATALLKQPQISNRTKMLEKLIKVAQSLREMNNFHILMAVISGLSNSAVLRLKWTKDRLASKYNKVLAGLEAELGMEGSFKNYRALLTNLAQNSITTPVIPYMGVYLTDLTFMEDGNKDNIGLKINFYKRQLVYNVIHQILRFQQVPFNFSVQPKIVQFLDNLPKLSDEELYKLSLASEPRNAQRSQIQ